MTSLHNSLQRERWIAFLCAQPLPLEVRCEPWRRERSLTQNSYLFGFVYPPLVEVCGFSTDEWHEHFCGERFGWVEHFKPNGRSEYRPRRTTTTDETGKRGVLKGQEFDEFVKFVEAECAQRGVFIERQWEVDG